MAIVLQLARRAVTALYGDSNELDQDNRMCLDDHHSPLTPERYLRLRVEPLIRFYQKRLPQYYSSRSMAEGVIITGSLAGAILAICQIDEVRAVFVAASSLVTCAESSMHGAVDGLRVWYLGRSHGLEVSFCRRLLLARLPLGAEASVCRSAFNDTNRKLTRYSNTVEKTKSLLLWWEGQTEVDQANVSSIETLVTEAEEVRTATLCHRALA